MKQPRKKNSKKQNQLPTSLDSLSGKVVTSAHMETLIKSALHRHIENKNQLKTERTGDLNHLNGIISEYLDCFIVIGYDMANSQVNFIHAKDQKDSDALSSAINRFFYQAQNNIKPSNSDD